MSQAIVNANISVDNDKLFNIPHTGKPCRLLRCIPMTAVISVCINIGLVLYLSLNQTRQSSVHGKHTPSPLGSTDKIQRNSVCVECRVLGLTFEQALNCQVISAISVRDEHLCCIPDAENLSKLLSVFIVSSMMLKRPERSGLSVHLYLDTLEANNYKWSEEYGFGAAHLAWPMQLKNGRLYIGKSGLYNIYSFLTLKRRTDERKPTKIQHSVRKISDGEIPHHAVLLRTSVELPRKSETFSVSYLSGIVYLKADDELYVDVSDVKAVYRYAPSNFFGLHLIQEV